MDRKDAWHDTKAAVQGTLMIIDGVAVIGLVGTTRHS
jgi:hypothetical protein